MYKENMTYGGQRVVRQFQNGSTSQKSYQSRIKFFQSGSAGTAAAAYISK